MPAAEPIPAMEPPPPVIAFQGVGKGFVQGGERRPALQGLDFAAGSGSITGLVGPDGAGKTTILRLCAGLLLPDTGEVRVFGEDMRAQAQAVQARLGYMPQRFGLYEDLSVRENLRLYADLHGVAAEAREARFEQLLGFTGLGPFTARLAGKLSGGMKQKLGLACVLMARPSLLLLDEPTVGVDPVSRSELWRMIRSMMEAGTSVLVSTAYLEEAERCDRVLLLHEGRLLDQGEPTLFRERLQGRTYSLPFEGAGRRDLQERLGGVPGVMDAVIQGDQVRLLLAADARIDDVQAATEVPIRAVPPRFEDAFVDLLVAGHNARPTIHLQTPPPADAAQAEAVIVLDKVQRRFGDFVAVRDVDLSVRRGEILGLVGPNGAGKSTVIRMLCGLLPPSGGSARVLDLDLARASGRVRARIGYMSQRFSLYRQLSVRQNLHFFAGAYALPRRLRAERCEQALADYGLQKHADTPSGTLPLGYQQRLALACALLHGPEIVFLDEPTSGVDPLARRAFWSRINALADGGVTVLVTTHFIEEAEYCDRVAIMHEGRLIADDSPERLKAAARRPGRPLPTLEQVFVQRVTAGRPA